MSCWVVPSIAAEMWGVSVNHVMEGIRGGKIPSRSELGFTVVDVAPEPDAAARRKPAERPRTFMPVTPVEMPAPIAVSAASPAAATLDSEDDPSLQFDWRQARREVGRLRLRPANLQ
jgi:hypothetical protein